MVQPEAAPYESTARPSVHAVANNARLSRPTREEPDGLGGGCEWLGWASRTELPQVMIHVKVREAHPFPIGHLAKVRVGLPLEVSGLPRKAIHEAP